MRKLFLLICLSTASVFSKAQNYIGTDILQSVFELKYGNGTGTCFIITVDHHDYLVTARHLFPMVSPKSLVSFDILRNTGWTSYNATLLIHKNNNIDIAVLDMNTSIQKQNNFDLTSAGMIISQDCFFLGFPFGLGINDKEGTLNRGFPIPFVKKGIISSLLTDDINGRLILLDGHNNQGFSGGPVVIISTVNNIRKTSVIGVVTAYLNENATVGTPVGSVQFNANSGIVLCYDIAHVFEIIKANN